MASIVCEPDGRNTGPAIALAAVYARERLTQTHETIWLFPPTQVIDPLDPL